MQVEGAGGDGVQGVRGHDHAGDVAALLVAVFRGFEQPSPAPVRPGSGPLAALGITLCLLGVLGLSMVGFAGLLEGRTATLIAVPVSAPAAVATALAGWWLVERSGFAVRRDEG